MSSSPISFFLLLAKWHCWVTILLLTRTVSAFARPRSAFYRSLAAVSASSSSSSSNSGNSHIMSSSSLAAPPTAKREEDRVIYAGVAPPGWDLKVLRQSEGSTEPMMDPPIGIPDPYGWMRDDKRESTQVLEHLELENAYTKSLTDHLTPLKDKIYQEMVAAIQETDYTVPRPRQEYVYYSRTFQGKSYAQHVRAPKQDLAAAQNWDGTAASTILAEEQILLDVNVLAEGKKYCSTGAIKTSPSQDLVAYSVDFTGGETYLVWIQNINTGEIVEHDDQLETSGNLVWGKDDSTLFYMKMDSNHRPYQLYRRTTIGSASTSDELLMEEKDDMMYSHISKSLDGKYLFMESASKETSEIWYLDLEDPDPTAKMQCVAKRRDKVLYDVDHRHDTFWISTNIGGSPNMKLMTCPVKPNGQADWKLVEDQNGQPLFDGSYDRALEDVSVFDSHVVLSGRQQGIPRVWILDPATSSVERLEFDEPGHDVGLSANHEFVTDSIAITYDSMVTPPQTMEISLSNPSAEHRNVLKAKHVPGYDKDLYACDRLTVPSRDGQTQIPISLVYRKDVMQKAMDNQTPTHTHLYGYGSYGASIEADFRSTRLPLLDRGVIYVIAHIRGGGEMGRQWYEEPKGAKYLCKKNTFHDFVDVARWLIETKKLTTPDLLSCEGRSAGGMLIGSSINQAPELFKCAMLGVPFVDVVCTMIDASIPLTALEWVEWGNPNEVKYHQYMMEYSPMNTVRPGLKYPACWLTGGLHDPRVPYWEPAKLAATLRHAASADSGPICVKMDLSAGHFSASDRYKYLSELALDYAFLLDQVGTVDTKENK